MTKWRLLMPTAVGTGLLALLVLTCRPAPLAAAGTNLATSAQHAYPQTVQAAVAAQQTNTSTLTNTASITALLALTVTDASAASAAQTTPVTGTQGVTTSASMRAGLGSNESTATVTPPLTATEPLTDSIAPVAVDDSAYEGAQIEGTILANRTESLIRFFVEGQTYTLDAQRSIGLDLPRVNGVLNLFNCDANLPETEEGCYWDPYLLNRDSFYEIVTGAEAGKAVNLTLQEAGSPSATEVWIQNRTGKREIVVYRNETFELAPASVQEFSTAADEIPTFFLSSCVQLNGESVCEWLPIVVETGVYYALTEIDTVGGLPNSRVMTLELQPVLAAKETTEVVERPKQMLCTLQVPALNVRSGPGLQYEIVAKIRGTETEQATVLVIGRDGSGEWLAVDDRVALGGWVTGSPNFILCEGAILDLNESTVTDGRLAAPTPEPVVVQATDSTTDTGEVTADDSALDSGETAVDGEPAAIPSAPIAIPDGLAALVINNSFDHEIRFTLDQKFRVEVQASEFDLQPGESATILIYPGFISFSVSSPWSGLSGNDDFFIEENQSRTLWLFFMPDPDGSGRWILKY